MGHSHRIHHHRQAALGEGSRASTHEESPTFRARARLDIGQVADQVAALAQALRTGGVTIRTGGQAVALRTAETAELEIRVEEGHSSVVRIEIRWVTPVEQEDIEITPGTEALQPSGASASAEQPSRSVGAPGRHEQPEPSEHAT